MRKIKTRGLSRLIVAALVVLGAGFLPESAQASTPKEHHVASYPDRSYVAMGDSYSSGEGTFAYTPESNLPANQCHRSPLAYAPLLVASADGLQPFSFVACSGALTLDLYENNHAFGSEVAQLDALSKSTRAVSLTVGGNDVGFAQVAGACVHSVQTAGYDCSADPALTRLVAARIDTLAGKSSAPSAADTEITAVKQILRDISRRAPHAKIYLAGYPSLFGSRKRDFTAVPTAPSTYACQVNPLLGGAWVDYHDAQWINRSTAHLNRVLKKAVKHAKRSGIRASYVPVATFKGHSLCDKKTAWLNPLIITDPTGQPLRESLHPNVLGYSLGYARAFHRAGL